MASLGSLASLISQLGSTQIPQYDPIQVARQQQGLLADRTGNQTALLQLADLKRQQASAANARRAIQEDPSLLGLGSQGPLASLSAGGPPGAIQQSPLPGMPGQAQTIPAPQDLSQFATGQPPAGSQGQTQRPVNRIEDLARTDPDAALKILTMQEQRLEQRLNIGTKVLSAVGQYAQGATDQASWDQARMQVQQISPQAAAQMPQTFSKEARDRFVQQALSVKEAETLKVHTLTQQVELAKATLTAQAKAGTIPNYTGDAAVDAEIYTRLPADQKLSRPPDDIVRQATDAVQQRKVEVVRQTGAAQEAEKPLDEGTRQRVSVYRRGEQLANQLMTEFTSEERAKFVGLGGMRMTGKQIEAWLQDATRRQADPRFARFLTLLKEAQAEAFGTAGKALTETEKGIVFGYIPTGQEQSAEQFEQKLTAARDRASTKLDDELTLATTPKRELSRERTEGTLARPGGQQAQAPGKGGKVTLEVLGEYATKNKITIGEAIKRAQAKGLEIE